jgi:cell division septum initiation protein DivIVA
MRQIGAGFQTPSMIVLEERMHRLEHRVAALTGAVTVLARALEDAPEAAQPGAADAARWAREILADAHDHGIGAPIAVSTP